jgi:hypothetical protein
VCVCVCSNLFLDDEEEMEVSEPSMSNEAEEGGESWDVSVSSSCWVYGFLNLLFISLDLEFGCGGCN